MTAQLEDEPELFDPGADAALWAATLKMLIDDAQDYWRKGCTTTDAEQAFDDVMRIGPMLRYVCAHTGHSPAWVSQWFIKWAESQS